jgi:hypothetical protein
MYSCPGARSDVREERGQREKGWRRKMKRRRGDEEEERRRKGGGGTKKQRAEQKVDMKKMKWKMTKINDVFLRIANHWQQRNIEAE